MRTTPGAPSRSWDSGAPVSTPRPGFYDIGIPPAAAVLTPRSASATWETTPAWAEQLLDEPERRRRRDDGHVHEDRDRHERPGQVQARPATARLHAHLPRTLAPRPPCHEPPPATSL